MLFIRRKRCTLFVWYLNNFLTLSFYVTWKFRVYFCLWAVRWVPSLLKLKLVFFSSLQFSYKCCVSQYRQFVFHFEFKIKKLKKKWKKQQRLTDKIHECSNRYRHDDRDSTDIPQHLPNMLDLWIPSGNCTWNFPSAMMYRCRRFDMATMHTDSVFRNVFLLIIKKNREEKEINFRWSMS